MDPRAVTPSDSRARLAAARIHLVVTEAACRGPWDEAVARALESGAVAIVQLREKDVSDADFLRRAGTLRALARTADALFVVNDRVHLVADSGADGVHLGEYDLRPPLAREILGEGPLIGVSTHDAAEVAAARGLGADYVGLGPCFPTGTKRLSREPRGADLVWECAGATDLPLFPIGGITARNVGELVLAGASRAAVSAGILGAEDPAERARAILARLLAGGA